MPEETAEQIIAQANDWREWGAQFGWQIYGCSGAGSAGFHRLEELRGLPFTITGKMRADIDRVIAAQK